MRHTTKQWIALAGLGLALLAIGAPVRAQTPTAEGTVITNTATASWTDANGNSYTAVTSSVALTVDFLPGLDATTATASVSPGSPTTGNEVTIGVHNLGNGRDSVSMAFSSPTGITITGFKIGATTFADLPALNDYLSKNGIAADGTVNIVVVYDVATGREGTTVTLTATATSVRVPATTDAQDVSISPILANGVSVTPDASAISRLPSHAGATQYTAQFTVQNLGMAASDFDLSAAAGAGLTIVSVAGGAGTTGSLTALGAGSSQTVDVIYTVNDDAVTGSTPSLTLTATKPSTAYTDNGSFVITVIRAAITVSKQAYRDDGTTLINPATDKVLPGEYIRYKITVTNGGSAQATTVSVSDVLPAQVTYQSSTPEGGAGWTLGEAGGTVTGTLATLPAPPGANTHYFWIRVQVK